jgi:Glutathione S-transferase, C-terminal domain
MKIYDSQKAFAVDFDGKNFVCIILFLDFDVLCIPQVTQTYVVGHSLTLADIALVLLVKRNGFTPSAEQPAVSRWFNLVAPTLPHPKSLTSSAGKAKAAKGASSSGAAGGSAGAKTSTKAAADGTASASAGGSNDEEK